MKNLIRSCFAFVCAMLVLTSCSNDPCGNNKDAFLKNFNALVDKVEAIEYDAKNAKWEGYNEEFKRMVDECYKIHEDDLTRREEKDFGKKVAVYYLKTFKDQVKFEEYAAEFGKLMDDNLDGLSDKISTSIKDLDIDINLNDQEIEELFEELGSDIEKMGKKWGKKLENILQKE